MKHPTTRPTYRFFGPNGERGQRFRSYGGASVQRHGAVDRLKESERAAKATKGKR